MKEKNELNVRSEEAYRSLRTNIQFASVDKEIKSILVTSSIPGEGKSTVASNLAISLSYTGKKVILVDCDLRKPTIHRKLELSNQDGVTDALVKGYQLKRVLKKKSDTLHLVTAGTLPPNPAEIVGSEAMVKFIESLKNDYDYIIIDSPPLLSVTDPQLLAVQADATLLVVRENKAKLRLVTRAYETLKHVNANVIGTVLNDCKESFGGYSYYYEYGEKKVSENKFMFWKKN